MSYQSRAYETEHGDPVVVVVVRGTHDVSRLVQALHHGNCEQWSLAEQVLRQVKRRNAGRLALRLLRDHGGIDFADEPEELADRRARKAELRTQVDALLDECDRVDHAVGLLPNPGRAVFPGGLIRTDRVRRTLSPQPEAVGR